VEGHSTDRHLHVLQAAQAASWHRRISSSRKVEKEGRGIAVRLRLRIANPGYPDDPRRRSDGVPGGSAEVYRAIRTARAELRFNRVPGVYPIETEAMRFLNLLGNKFFAMRFHSSRAALKDHAVRNQG